MWITLLVMAVAVSLEPFRIGMTVLMINRPRPLLQLLAFLAGGFAMGIAVGWSCCSSCGRRWVRAFHIAQGADRGRWVLWSTLPGGRRPGRRRGDGSRASPQGDSAARDAGPAAAQRPLAVDGGASRAWHRAAVRRLSRGAGAHRRLRRRGRSQVGALLTFNVVAFAFVEIPLIAYLVAPARTRRR